MNKQNIVMLLLNILCFIVVFIGSLIEKKDNMYFNIVLCLIILVSIIVQIVAIVKERKEKIRSKNEE